MFLKIIWRTLDRYFNKIEPGRTHCAMCRCWFNIQDGKMSKFIKIIWPTLDRYYYKIEHGWTHCAMCRCCPIISQAATLQIILRTQTLCSMCVWLFNEPDTSKVKYILTIKDTLRNVSMIVLLAESIWYNKTAYTHCNVSFFVKIFCSQAISSIVGQLGHIAQCVHVCLLYKTMLYLS